MNNARRLCFTAAAGTELPTTISFFLRNHRFYIVREHMLIFMREITVLQPGSNPSQLILLRKGPVYTFECIDQISILPPRQTISGRVSVLM